MSKDRGKVFAALAVAFKKVSPALLSGMGDSVEEEVPADVGQKLVDQGLLSVQDFETLDGMTSEAIRTHDGDVPSVLQSLLGNTDAALTVDANFLDSLVEMGVGFTETPALDRNMLQDGTELVPAVEEHAGRYEEKGEFAKGGMGRILLVHDSHLGRDVAMKMLLTKRLPGGTRTGLPTTEMLTVPIFARFLQEARVTGQLEHPSIIPVYELGYRANGDLYYTMKMVRGKSLQDAVKSAKGIEERLPLLTNFLDLCFAISYAHSCGVIHRDLKPMNVMLGEFGETVVIDWGISKVRGEMDIHEKELKNTIRKMTVGDAEATAKTLYGQTIGSPYYMPPEQAAGHTRDVDERSDVYALGAVLYSILSGSAPYSGSSVKEFMQKISSFPPKPLKEVEPRVPAELAAVCARAMAYESKDRYQSVKELTEEVQNYLSGGLVSAYEYRFSELAKRFVKKHRKVLTAAAAGAISLALFGVWSFINITREKNEALRQQGIAYDQRIIADDQRVIAEKQTVIAVAAEKDALQELYYANVSRSQTSIGQQLMAPARTFLEASPEPFRAWEWGHLQALSNADLMTLTTGGSYVAFTSSDQLITGGSFGTVSLQDLKTGAPVHTMIDQAGATYGLAFSRDGSRVAMSSDVAVVVWDAASNTELLRFDELVAGKNPHQLSMSANGQRVAVTNNDRKARVWDVDSGALIFETAAEGRPRAAVKLSPSGDRVLILGSEFEAEGWVRTFSVFDIASKTALGTGTLLSHLSAHTATFGPTGRLLVLGTEEGLQVWDVNAWELIHTDDDPEIRFRHPGTLVFNADGSLLATATKDGDLRIRNMATGKNVEWLTAHQSAIRSLAFSHDEQWLATVSEDKTARLWSVPDLRLLRTFQGHVQTLMSLAFSPDDAKLATGAFAGEAKLWDLQNELEYAPVKHMVFHPGKGLLAGSLVESEKVWSTVGVWSAHTGHRKSTLKGHTANLATLAFDESGESLATVAHEGAQDVIRIWDVAQGEQRYVLQSLGSIGEIVLNNGGQTVYERSGSTLSLLDVDSGGALWTQQDVSGFTLSPDELYFAILRNTRGTDASNLLSVELWAADGSSRVAEFQANTELAPNVNVEGTLAFSPDGNMLLLGTAITGSRGVIHAWNIETQEVVHVLEGHNGLVSTLIFNADGSQLASGSKDSDIRLWNAVSGDHIVTMTGHDNDIKDIVFSPDGERLVSASIDGTFKIWDTSNGQEVLTVQSSVLEVEGLQDTTPESVAFSADGHQLIALTADEILAPVVLHAYPWESSAYPAGEGDGVTAARVEAFKRTYWE